MEKENDPQWRIWIFVVGMFAVSDLLFVYRLLFLKNEEIVIFYSLKRRVYHDIFFSYKYRVKAFLDWIIWIKG